MEVIKIKTHGQFELTAYKDKIQFIDLAELLEALQVEFVEDVIKYIKEDLHWFTSVKQMDLPEVGTKDVIQLTHALGLIYWLPNGMVEFLNKHEVYNAIAIHLETYLEFFQWKLSEVEKSIDKMESLRLNLNTETNNIIKVQSEMIDQLKEALNLNI